MINYVFFAEMWDVMGCLDIYSSKKPDDFKSTEAYIKHLNEEMKADRNNLDKLTPEEREKYRKIGAEIEIQAIREKYNVELSEDFLEDVQNMKK